MQQQLSDIIDQLEQAQAHLDKVGETIPDDRWNVRNDPARWSVAECVAHLNLTSAAYVPRIRKAIEEARQLPPFKGTYHRDFIGWLFAVMTGPLPKIGKKRIGRVKTTAPFVPTGNHPRQLTLAEFKRLQLELIGMVRESSGLAIDKTRIRSPFGEKIGYNTYSTFLILPAHQERHLQQAESVWG
jgi:hypothetical protein